MPIDELVLIKQAEVESHDKHGDGWKSVFIFIDPDKKILEQDSTKGIDIFVFLKSKPEERESGVYLGDTVFPDHIKQLTSCGKSLVFYRL